MPTPKKPNEESLLALITNREFPIKRRDAAMTALGKLLRSRPASNACIEDLSGVLFDAREDFQLRNAAAQVLSSIESPKASAYLCGFLLNGYAITKAEKKVEENDSKWINFLCNVVVMLAQNQGVAAVVPLVDTLVRGERVPQVLQMIVETLFSPSVPGERSLMESFTGDPRIPEPQRAAVNKQLQSRPGTSFLCLAVAEIGASIHEVRQLGSLSGDQAETHRRLLQRLENAAAYSRKGLARSFTRPASAPPL